MSDSRYIVRATKFFCGDESGFDIGGADEPYWVFSTRDANGAVHTIRSKEFGDVDSGETRKFPDRNDQNVIWPRQGAVKGAAGPIAISIQLWEADQGDKNEIVKKTQKAFDLGAKAPVIGDWIKLASSVVKDKIAGFVGDDLMGSKTLLFTESQLARKLPRVRNVLRVKHHFSGSGGDLPFEIAGSLDYDLFLAITRVA